MSSTFHGLETAKRGMYAQQNALYITGHNIANANTPGFSRQRVNFVQSEPYPAAAMNRPQIPGQMGTGVYAGTVERVRESFLDIQFRNENSKLGYWDSRATALSKMEDIINEPSENGLSAVMGEFWQSLQDLATYPENEGTRQVVLQRAQSVVDTFHYLHESLTSIKNDLGNEVKINLQEINSILSQISDLNRQIGEVEPHGYLPNDLYDQRDLLVDELSKHLSIKVNKTTSGGQSQKVAEGQYEIILLNADGSEMKDENGDPIQLVSGSNHVKLGFEGTNGISFDVPETVGAIAIYDSQATDTPKSMITITDSFSTGKLKGLVQSYGYHDGTATKGVYTGMLDQLDKLAFTYANMFNEEHAAGYNLDGKNNKQNFFEITEDKNNYSGSAKSIKLANINPGDIAAADSPNAGNGKNAQKLANLANVVVSSGDPDSNRLIDGSFNTVYEGIIGNLGVDALQANRMVNNSKVLSQSVENKRQSVSSVSLDEEMANIIKFQHAYNAAARQITTIDEMLDRVINGMGRVGR